MHVQIGVAIFSNSVPIKLMCNTIFIYKSQYILLAKEQDGSEILLDHQIIFLSKFDYPNWPSMEKKQQLHDFDLMICFDVSVF